MANRSPYEDLPDRAFWRKGVAMQDPLTPVDIYRRKFRIRRKDRIATAGSCFAQHISRHLSARGFNVMNLEPAPRGMSPEAAAKYGFGVYSCRYGNIYTAPQLLQLAEEAFGISVPADRVWERDGRFFDAQRPNVEPTGFPSAEDVLAAREKHLAQVRRMLVEMDLFIFTFGLTEAWIHRESGTVFPTAPGTIAGAHDPDVYAFHNFTFTETKDAFLRFMRLVKSHREKPPRYLVTVSPVPLTATASDNHVAVATCHSKSVLRAVCGELAERLRVVDYFPSYEIITAPASRGVFYAPNLRSVTPAGVETVMRTFFAAHDPMGAEGPTRGRAARQRAGATEAAEEEGDVVCEDALLEAFAK